MHARRLRPPVFVRLQQPLHGPPVAAPRMDLTRSTPRGGAAAGRPRRGRPARASVRRCGAVAGCGCPVLCPPAHVSPRRKAQWLTGTAVACAGAIRGRRPPLSGTPQGSTACPPNSGGPDLPEN